MYERLKRDIKRIAVHSGSLIVGDAVMLNPLVRSLRDSFPGTTIDYIGNVKPFVMEFAKRVLPFDHFIEMELKGGAFSIVRDLAGMVFKIRKMEYDLIVDNQWVAIRTIILKLSRKRWLLSQSMGGMMSDLPVPSKQARPRHIIDRSISPLKLLGLPNVYSNPEIQIEETERKAVEDILKSKGISKENRIAGISPYSNHEIKNWPANHFSSLIEKLSESRYGNIVVFLSRAQLEKAKADFKSLKVPIIYSIELLPESENINKALPLVERMNLFISNDSGLSHAASALGVPTIAIFGPTSPERFGPRGKRVQVMSSPASCAPCDIYKPCRHKKDCLDKISPSEVFDAAMKFE